MGVIVPSSEEIVTLLFIIKLQYSNVDSSAIRELEIGIWSVLQGVALHENEPIYHGHY